MAAQSDPRRVLIREIAERLQPVFVEEFAQTGVFAPTVDEIEVLLLHVNVDALAPAAPATLPIPWRAFNYEYLGADGDLWHALECGHHVGARNRKADGEPYKAQL